mmetsp:Transcript_20624/g.32202  ORF Transcript_20624/g.32202 Transcript_20624/m.32202 type:complete len:229 (-) Transcript_20624:520-1206(-)
MQLVVLTKKQTKRDQSGPSFQTWMLLSSHLFKQIPRFLCKRQPNSKPLKKILFENPDTLEDEFERALVLQAKGNPRLILSYVHCLVGGTKEKLNEVKCMFTGYAATGKTTLVRALQEKDIATSPISTDGIDLGSLKLGDITLHTWDFGGQEVYQYTHQLFLTSNAVYLVLFRLNEPTSKCVEQVKFWLDSIVARTQLRKVKVILLGTHADQVAPQDIIIPKLTKVPRS